MEAPVTPQTPIQVARLVDRLKTDCGAEAKIQLIADGTTHGGKQRKFSIHLTSKAQKLNSLCCPTEVDIVMIKSKRSGAFVKTQIDLKVDVSPITSLQA